MGHVSYFCKISEKQIQKDDAVHLFLLKNGIVLEHMFGNYTCYCGVYNHSEKKEYEWEMDWNKVNDLHLFGTINDGIAAILAPYWKEGDPFPREKSLNDLEQGDYYDPREEEDYDPQVDGLPDKVGWNIREEPTLYNNKPIKSNIENSFHRVFYK